MGSNFGRMFMSTKSQIFLKPCLRIKIVLLSNIKFTVLNYHENHNLKIFITQIISLFFCVSEPLGTL